VNEHADFWSLGVMLFEMVAGVRPYYQYEHNRSRLERAIRTQEPRAPLPATVDPRLAAIIGKLLAPQVENRYQSARQIAGDLGAYLDGTPVVAFIEASRASQATVRIPATTHRDRTNWNQPTEPLPRPVAAAPVEPPPALAPPVTPTLPAAPAIAAIAIPLAPRAPEVPAANRRYAAWIAAALSLLAPGLGQIYNREYLRAIFWLIITPGFWIGSAGLFGWPFHLIAAYTAYRRAGRKPNASSVRLPPNTSPVPADA
jgi:hypothetical protein